MQVGFHFTDMETFIKEADAAPESAMLHGHIFTVAHKGQTNAGFREVLISVVRKGSPNGAVFD